jgi:hypothetical protein
LKPARISPQELDRHIRRPTHGILERHRRTLKSPSPEYTPPTEELLTFVRDAASGKDIPSTREELPGNFHIEERSDVLNRYSRLVCRASRPRSVSPLISIIRITR